MKKRFVVSIILSVLMLAILVSVAQAQVIWPSQDPPAIAAKKTQTVYPATTATAGTAYGSAYPLENFRTIDVFSTVDVSGTAQSVVSIQFSADGLNWADADYAWDKYTGSGTVVSNTDGMTDTLTLADAITTQAWSITLAADGTDFMVLPAAGEFFRVKVVSTRSGLDNSTTTVKTTLKR